MDPIPTLYLQSCTVFWQDLGLTERRKMTDNQLGQLATFWNNVLEEWINDSVHHDWNSHDAGVWFANRHDAMMFLLRWKGNFLF